MGVAGGVDGMGCRVGCYGVVIGVEWVEGRGRIGCV